MTVPFVVYSCSAMRNKSEAGPSAAVDEGRVSVTVLAPAYNEEAVLEQFCAAVIEELGPDWELLLVDDGSTDRTREIAEHFARADARVRLVAHDGNRGLGAALSTGIAHARGDLVITMDADLSHPLELLPAMIAECADADVVFASRFIPGGGMVDIPWWRIVSSQIANRMLRVLFATRTHDLTTGFRVYRRTALRDLRVRAHGFAAQLEVTVRLQAAGYRAAEVPFVLGSRAAGSSKMRYFALIPGYAATTVRLLGVRWRGRKARRATSLSVPSGNSAVSNMETAQQAERP